MLRDRTSKTYRVGMRNHALYPAVAALVAVAAATWVGGARTSVGMLTVARGWNLGQDAETKKNPVTPDPPTLAAGKAIYTDKCQRCHGPGGLDDGPESEPDARANMDLTNPTRAVRNPDGVVYYKVMNGRRRPKMPAFNGELSEQQIWTVVAYTQSLRKK